MVWAFLGSYIYIYIQLKVTRVDGQNPARHRKYGFKYGFGCVHGVTGLLGFLVSVYCILGVESGRP